jgi:hypothetical protein
MSSSIIASTSASNGVNGPLLKPVRPLVRRCRCAKVNAAGSKFALSLVPDFGDRHAAGGGLASITLPI